MDEWYVYLLRCADGTLYCGTTNDLERRVRQHNGELVGGAKYTSSRRPVELKWSKSCANQSAACKEELRVRRLSKAEKERLCAR